MISINYDVKTANMYDWNTLFTKSKCEIAQRFNLSFFMKSIGKNVAFLVSPRGMFLAHVRKFWLSLILIKDPYKNEC